MRTFNVGIVGLGFIGKVHAYGYLNLPLFYDPPPCRARITHVCTAHAETAEAGREQIGADVATTDYRTITENPDIDIVHICTPNSFHREQLLSAMAHGKHIYCDKPLTANMDEARDIATALENYAGTAGMTFQNRFFPATMRAKQLMDTDFIGEVLEFRAAYLHSGSADPDAPLKWKLSAAYGGGVIADLASHALDLMNHLLGDFEALFAVAQIAYDERPALGDPSRKVPVEAEDAVKILARLQNGTVGVVEASKIATGTEDELRFEIHGSEGALRFNLMDPHHLEVYDRRESDRPLGGGRGWKAVDTGQRYPKPGGFPTPKASIGWMRSHMACLYHFLASAAADEPADPGLAQGIYVQKLIEAARISSETGRWVETQRE
jgi:predicted dehydrogenase